MYTSCFARVELIRPPLVAVSIARWPPRYWTGRREYRLAPSADMMRRAKAGSLDADQWDREYDALLAALDAQALVADLGENAVLLCFEPPGFRCHRRRAAEWLEGELALEVPELGFPRSVLMDYADSPWTGTPTDELPWKANCDHCRKLNRISMDMSGFVCKRCGRRSVLEWD